MENNEREMLFGPYGTASLKHASNFEKYGANAVWFHGFDAKAFEVCNHFSLSACVEFETFRANFDKHPALVPTGSDGKPIRYGSLVQGMCLANKGILDEIESNLITGIKQFKPKGIWFDYLTYAGWFETENPDLQDSCFCRLCIDDFCDSTGIDADNPVIILKKHANQWKQYKCKKIARYAMYYSKIVHSYHPDCIIGAYMCPWTPDEYERALSRIFAQDYSMLANSIDIFTPLIYATKSGRTNIWGKEFLEKSEGFVPNGKKIQLILDYQDFPQSLEIAASSRIPSWGIQIYSGSGIFENPEQADIFRQAVVAIRQSACCQQISSAH